MGKILRGNVYVISNNQYDSLQDGFIETKDYMYKTERTKDEIEIGKELTHQIKPYQEQLTFSAEEYEQNQSLQIAGMDFICRFLYWYSIFRLRRKFPLLPFILRFGG